MNAPRHLTPRDPWTSGPFRVLELPHGEERDHDGRSIGDDWYLLPLGKCGHEALDLHLTTDRVRASGYASAVPQTEAGLARLIAYALNYTACNHPDWRGLLGVCETPRTPVCDHPRWYEVCAGCGERIVGGGVSYNSGDGWKHTHVRCDPLFGGAK